MTAFESDCKFCSKKVKVEGKEENGKKIWIRTNIDDGTVHKCSKPREPIMTKEQGDKIIALLERISGQLANK